MTVKRIGVGTGFAIAALAAVGAVMARAIARQRRRAARDEDARMNRWEGEGGALADAPAPPHAPRPAVPG